MLANNTREADAGLLLTDTAVVFAIVFLEGALHAAQEQGIKNSWGLLAPLSADPAHLAASVNMVQILKKKRTPAARAQVCLLKNRCFLRSWGRWTRGRRGGRPDFLGSLEHRTKASNFWDFFS